LKLAATFAYTLVFYYKQFGPSLFN